MTNGTVTTGVKTVGVKPAFYLAIIAAMLSTLATQTLVDFAPGVDLAIIVGSTGIATALAGPGTVEPK